MADHSAAAPLLGYLHQVQWALLELVRAGKTQPDIRVSIETVDDVALEDSSGAPLAAIQLKQHGQGAGDLTDMSVDMWKTLKVWLDNPVLADRDGPLLHLVTTALAPVGTAASHLTTRLRDSAKAEMLLTAAAENSKMQVTEAARNKWLATPVSTRLNLLDRVFVADASLGIADVDKALRAELLWALPLKGQDLYIQQITGWWQSVAVTALRSGESISAEEVRLKLADVRDQYSEHTLPVSAPVSVPREVLDPYFARVFVSQLGWIDVGDQGVLQAVVDYYRAVTQATHWTENVLVSATELSDFEQRVKSEWAVKFEDMVQDLPSGADEDAKKAAGRKLYRGLRDSTETTIRALFNDPFYTRGVRHQLADRLPPDSLGWHPEFLDKLDALIPAGSVLDA